MARLVLLSWDRDGGAHKARLLRAGGHSVRSVAPAGMADLKPLLDKPPDALVVDLDRRPSEGRSVAVLLRQRTATRRVPLVFVGGAPADVARVQALLPDGTFVADWQGVEGSVEQAIANAPANPVVRGTMDAYAGASLVQKLGARSTVALLNAPEGWERMLEGVDVTPPPAEIGILFVSDHTELDRLFATATEAFTGSLWIAWPKRASGRASDLTQVSVRRYGMERGLVDYKVAALDDTWSGLRFARRS